MTSRSSLRRYARAIQHFAAARAPDVLALPSLSPGGAFHVCAAAAGLPQQEFRRGSIYYASPLAFTHAFSRAHADGGVRCLSAGVPKIRAATLSLQKSDGGWANDLETALGALTLLNLGYRSEALDRAVRVILARQSTDGGWALATAYRGAVLPLHYGSRSLTTAVCLEVLAKYSK